MDANRFDALSRSLSASPSRRGALRLLTGSLFGGLITLGSRDIWAHNAKTACKKKSGDAKKKCLKKAKKHNAEHANEPLPPPPPPCAGVTCPVCQSCNPATGQCVAANRGAPCGTNSQSGGATRCCDGTCPNPVCKPRGDTARSCERLGDCLSANCCHGHGVDFGLTTCTSVGKCRCEGSRPGDGCGSDMDCTTVGSVCVCGTCTTP